MCLMRKIKVANVNILSRNIFFPTSVPGSWTVLVIVIVVVVVIYAVYSTDG